MGDDVVRCRLVVHGRVQGVGFRASWGRVARDAGVGGWVANQPDGTVAAEVEGPAEAVERVVAWCREGPPAAAVAGVDVEEVPPRGDREVEVR